tara:strand:+ start:85 stop:312 length:228 start_codon:yes stop_codon:yes gene_type:complete
MSSEDKALELLQGINKEIVIILSDIKAKRKQLKEMDIASITKLGELGQQLQQVKSHINDFINRYDKQTTLTDFGN